MPEIWFIRHAESAANAGAVSPNTATVPLSDKGVAQAREFALAFPRRPDLIVTSPFLRARQTADALLERYPEAPLETWPVQEFTFLSSARYANSSTEQRRPFSEAYWKNGDPDSLDGPGAESFAGAVARIRYIFARLQFCSAGFTAVFTHERFIQTARLILSRPELSVREMMEAWPDFNKEFHCANCSVLKIEAAADGVRLI